MSSVINAEKHRRCYKCGGSPAEDSQTSLFRFPKPGKMNTLRCELWAKYCFPDKEYCSPEFQHKLHSQHLMLCNRHFPRTSFSDYPITSKKLHRFAVPLSEDCADSGDSGPVEQPTDLPVAGDSSTVEEPTFQFDGTDICEDDVDDSDTVVESNSCSHSESCLYSWVETLSSTHEYKQLSLWEQLRDHEKKISCFIHFDQVCRVCLALDVKMYDLKDIELREMFQNITGIVVTENNHPILERLCWECAARLKAAAAFRNKALLSDALLQGLASTGEQIRKNDLTLIKENQDYLKSAGTLSTVEVFHTVDINAEYGSIRSVPENNDTNVVQNTVRKHLVELKQVIIKENNYQIDVEEESMIEAPIKTVIEYDTIRPDAGEKKRNIVLETNPPFSNDTSLREKTIISADSRPPPGKKIKKRNVKITKKDSISKIVSKKSKEVINLDHTLQGDAKLKNINLKVYGSSKKTSNQKLMERTQVNPNSPEVNPDEEYTDVEYLSFENYEF